MKRLARMLAAGVLLALWSGPAAATVGPRVKIRLLDIAGPATAGTPTSLAIELAAGEAVTLKDFRFENNRWVGVTHDAPQDSLVMAAGTTHTLHWQGIPIDPDSPVKIRFQVGTRIITKSFDLSRRHWDMVRRPNGLIATPELETAPAPTAPMAAPAPAGLEQRPAWMKPVRDASAGADNSVSGCHNVRIRGRFWYKRQDGTIMGADGVTVRAYDEDWDWDEHLGTTVTNSDGYFDFTVCCSEDAPDIYCELETSNGAVTVEDGSLTEDNYLFTTHVKDDFTGSDVNYGWFTCSDNSLWPAMHILTNVTRAWRWMYTRAGIDCPNVEVQWPDADWPHYDGEVHIPNSVDDTQFRWKTDTHIHEYGHHVMHNYMLTADPEYDNGVCNNPNGDPGHCAWCEETDHDAIGEGWPNWFADLVTRTYPGDYGLASEYTRSQESLQACQDVDNNPCDCNPYETEGYFGALARDIEDNNTGEDDGNAPGAWQDRIGLGGAAIFNLMRNYSVLTPQSFILAIPVAYPNANRRDLWETFMNAGYQNLDVAAPGAPQNFESLDHTPGFDSPDNEITMSWDYSNDDWSGDGGYSIRIGATAQMPDQTVEATIPHNWTSAELAVGTYWITIRAVDRTGKWSSTFATAGPFIIREPYPADLTDTTPAGWDDAIVPRGTNNATFFECTLPATLSGNSMSTYWNVTGRNAGELATPFGIWVQLRLDGEAVEQTTVFPSPVAAGQTFFAVNRGPIAVRGGRHTIEAFYESAEAIAEHYENNNHYGWQYVWTPLAMSMNQTYRRTAPPRKDGGWNSFDWPIGQPKWFNSDGLTYSHQTQIPGTFREFTAVYAVALDPDDDYDVYLHPHSTALDEGFTDGLDSSTRNAGLLDAVLTNRRNAVTLRWDVGVVNDNGGTGNYLVRQVTAGATMNLGDSVSITLGDSVMMALREFNVSPSQVGKVLVEVNVDSTQGPVTVLWFDDAFTFGGINDFDAALTTGSNGKAQLVVNVTSDGINGLAIYRNPTAGFAPVTVALRVMKKPADPTPASPAGWHAALTPRPAADGTPASVPMPGLLGGDVANTWFNVAVRNASDIAAPSIYTQITVDDRVLGGTLHFGVAGLATVTSNNLLPTPVGAGRHVLRMMIDPNQQSPELNEGNNVYGEQWVWAPANQALDAPAWRSSAGPKTAGWANVAPSQPLYFNCDGVRSPTFGPATGKWAGFAVVPGAGSDVDLRLHEQSAGSKSGFDLPLEYSGWEAGETDFILANFHATAYRGFDAGVLRATHDTVSYLTQIVGSIVHPTADGTHGPYTMDAHHVLQLHEFTLPAGSHRIRLVNLGGGTVDWGIALFDSERPYQNRTAGLDVGAEWLNGPGMDEELIVSIAEPGEYCLAVWKVGTSEAGKTGSFELNVNATVVSTPEAGPTATRLARAYPNPFATSARIDYTLAHDEDVVLEVFDLLGARVRTLEHGRFEAGRRSVLWDGADDGGRPLPAGLYFVRMQAGAFRGTVKVTRME